MKVLRLALLTLCGQMLCTPLLAAPAIDAPPTAQAGSVLTLTVSGSGDPRDFVSVVAKGSAEGRYNNYEYLAKPGQYKLELPSEAGDYEIRVYAAASPYATLLRRPIKLTMPTATVKAPASVPAGGQVEIAVRDGSAARRLGMGVGGRIRVRLG